MADPTQVHNAGDPQQVRRAGRADKRRAARRLAAYRAVLATPEGRFVLADLLARAGIYASGFAPDALRMAFLAGRREFGLELQATLIGADDRAYDVMEREARARAHADAQEAEAAHTPPAEERET